MSRVDITRLNRIIAGLSDAANAGVGDAATFVGDLAQQLAPRDTGALRASKQVRQVSPGVWVVTFGEGLRDIRAIAQEYGTINQPAQPYLTPATRAIDVGKAVTARISALIKGA